MYKRLQRDERGVGHLLIIVVAVVVIAGVGLVGWKVASKHKASSTGNNSTSSSSTTAASATADSSCLSTYHDANLCKFAANSSSLDKTAYTATITATQNGTTSTMTLENDGKGNTELMGSGSGETFNSITLNGVTYLQSNGTGPWIEYPTGSSAPTTDPTSNMNIAVGSSGITYKSLGTVSCGSLTCYKYEVTDSSTPTATQYAWFDTGSYKLRQWQYTDGSSNTTNMTISYGSVNITTPSPVESLSQAE